mgnify:CR=1 FL=1
MIPPSVPSIGERVFELYSCLKAVSISKELTYPLDAFPQGMQIDTYLTKTSFSRSEVLLLHNLLESGI